ncbi:AfsR/SARP family transcriptional regulator [Nonomuraea sp. NPDC050328]|uniref:AfsR/SARP family transcriptional regulator n=1 Tax=Nonomuraea sp. NPDC050328 TaxID=3364361 RepID=UPI0037BB7644
MTARRFSVLGPVTVARDGRHTSVPGGKARTLLAALLLRPNQVVLPRHLAERLWDGDPPPNPRRALQVNVARLRRSLDLSEVIMTVPGGYVARVGRGELDLLDFQRLTQEAALAATPVLERRLLREALALWRGPACSDVESGTLHRLDVQPLAEQRLQALERRVELGLQLGEGADLVAELRNLTAGHALPERLWGRLMTALDQDARGAAAAGAGEDQALGALLRAWRERALLTQDQLAERTGLNVRTVRRLESGQLRRPRPASIRLISEALDLDPSETSILTRSPSPVPSRTTPRQLPADVVAFVGREREMAALDHPGAGARIVAIDGMAGVGKTALAVHAAHRLAPGFPDGDLFLDLNGFSRGMTPADPADTLARVLGLLGLPGESIPQHAEDRAALYRSVLAGRRMLLVLDNAAGEDQVRPLLPGAGDCLVLITSRRRLTGLDEARTVTVDVLPEAEAIALFTGTAGRERLADAPSEAVAEVVRRCGLLPLAIQLAAARLKAHPVWSVSDLLERLTAHERRLGELQSGQRSVAAALVLSYRELTPAERRAYRLLGLHPGADIGFEAAAATLAAGTDTMTLLERLLELNLLQERVPGRYRFHDLVRAHAAETAAAEEPEPDRRAALTRLLDHYGQAASAAMDRLYPYEADLRPHPATDTIPLPSEAAAIAWLEAELANLLALARYAAEHGFPSHIRHLSGTLHQCLRTRGRYAEAEALLTRALTAALAVSDRTGEMEALLGLGEIRHAQSRYDTAVADTTLALDLACAIGHHAGRLRALNNLGDIHLSSARLSQAAGHFAQALEVARGIGHRTGELEALTGAGNTYRLWGRHDDGLRYLSQALALAQEVGHHTSELRALTGVGYIHLARGGFGAATEYFDQVLSLARATGHRTGELNSLNALAHLARLQGRHERARELYASVAGLAREIGNRNWQFEAVYGLGRLQHDTGHDEQAIDSHRRALDLAIELGQPSDQARVHDGLAHAHAALGHQAHARRHWAHALTLLASMGIDRMDENGIDVVTIRAHLDATPPDA